MNKQAIYEMVDEMLDSEGPIMIGSMQFYRSDILKKMDPVAYREVCINLIDSHLEDLQYDLEHSDDEEEISFIQEQIEELEDF